MFLVQAIFNSIGAWTVLAWGQQHVDSALAGVLNSTSPLFVFLITRLFLRRDEATEWKLAGALLGLAGVILIVGTDVLAGLGRNVVAQLAVLSGAVMYAGAAIYGRRFAALPPTVTAAGTMLWASAFLVPLSLLLDAPWRLAPTAGSLLAAAALAIFCTGVALLLYFRLVRTLGAFGVASQSYLRAGVSVLLGALVLGEQITPTIALGLGATVLGVAALNLPAARRARQS
jgi:drug/metabolite transporter (DMT)-like permease